MTREHALLGKAQRGYGLGVIALPMPTALSILLSFRYGSWAPTILSLVAGGLRMKCNAESSLSFLHITSFVTLQPSSIDTAARLLR